MKNKFKLNIALHLQCEFNFFLIKNKIDLKNTPLYKLY